eukprot:365356-Chlamydomonas_euryale.AAC.1
MHPIGGCPDNPRGSLPGKCLLFGYPSALFWCHDWACSLICFSGRPFVRPEAVIGAGFRLSDAVAPFYAYRSVSPVFDSRTRNLRLVEPKKRWLFSSSSSKINLASEAAVHDQRRLGFFPFSQLHTVD